MHNGNNRPPALCAGEVPDEKLKMNELGLLGFYHCLAIITIVLTVLVNSPLSSPCSEGTDPYSLDEIEEKAEQHTSDDDMESPFVAQYVCYYRVGQDCLLFSSVVLTTYYVAG